MIRTRVDHGDWLEERFDFDNGAGSRVPGYTAAEGTKGTGAGHPLQSLARGEYDGGLSELFESKHTPLVPGPELVRQGYAVMAVDARALAPATEPGRMPPAVPQGELSAAKLELWLGRSPVGNAAPGRSDGTRLFVFASGGGCLRIGATGISMGATRTWWLMALDERIRSGVAVACLTRYQDLIAAGGLRHHGIYYFAPGLLRHFDTEAVIACIAPRSLLCLNGDQDAGSRWKGSAPLNASRRRPGGVRRSRGIPKRGVIPGRARVHTGDVGGDDGLVCPEPARAVSFYFGLRPGAFSASTPAGGRPEDQQDSAQSGRAGGFGNGGSETGGDAVGRRTAVRKLNDRFVRTELCGGPEFRCLRSARIDPQNCPTPEVLKPSSNIPLPSKSDTSPSPNEPSGLPSESRKPISKTVGMGIEWSNQSMST